MRERETKALTYAKSMRRTLTKAEAILWGCLKGRNLNGHHFRRQHPIGPYIADFACVKAKLVLEVDGGTHMSTEELAYDAKRTAYLERLGWYVLRVWNNPVFENREGVLRVLDEAVSTRSAQSSPRVSGKGVFEADGGGTFE